MSDTKTDNGNGHEEPAPAVPVVTIGKLTAAVEDHMVGLTPQQRGIAKTLLCLPQTERTQILAAVAQLADVWGAATDEQLNRVLTSLARQLPIARFALAWGGGNKRPST